MKTMKKIKIFLLSIVEKIKEIRLKIVEKKKIKQKKRIELQKKVTLSKEDRIKVNAFYKKYYGKKISLRWHKEYYAISGKFDYKYFPELLYIPGFERLSNSPKYYDCLQNKNMLPLIIDGLDFVKMPKKIIGCSNGIITDEKSNHITFDDAIDKLMQYDEVFIKPSVDSCSGRGCKKINPHNMSRDDIVNLIKSYKKDYIVQGVLKNSKALAAINNSSVNTFRVITYILDGKIYHTPTILRIGRSGSYLDNAHAGGIFIGVNEDGTLLNFATSEFGEKYTTHPDSSIVFDGYVIPSFDKIISAAHKLQALFPRVGCINWDLTLDENENVILIEANMRGGGIWLPQMAHGKGSFGDNTERILEIVRNNKKLY